MKSWDQPDGLPNPYLLGQNLSAVGFPVVFSSHNDLVGRFFDFSSSACHKEGEDVALGYAAHQPAPWLCLHGLHFPALAPSVFLLLLLLDGAVKEHPHALAPLPTDPYLRTPGRTWQPTHPPSVSSALAKAQRMRGIGGWRKERPAESMMGSVGR